jgi:hypothetical protein
MPRKIPKCAFCGESLRNTACVRWEFSRIVGKPAVGWHMSSSHPCRTVDEAYKMIPVEDSMALATTCWQLGHEAPIA